MMQKLLLNGANMFLTWYRDIIAKQVENKMLYLNICPNDKNIILNIISPKTYKRKSSPLCGVCQQRYKCVDRWDKERRLEEESKLE